MGAIKGTACCCAISIRRRFGQHLMGPTRRQTEVDFFVSAITMSARLTNLPSV